MEIPFAHGDIEAVPWETVMATWQADEVHRAESDGAWQRRGYDSWEEWRLHRCRLLGLPERPWARVHVDDHSRAVPEWWGGPFQTWIDRYYADHALSEQLKTLVRNPAVATKERIRELMEHFPAATQVVGLLWRQRVLVFEGMHRSCAIALAAHEGRPVATDLSIVLADISDVDEAHLRLVAATQTKEG